MILFKIYICNLHINVDMEQSSKISKFLTDFIFGRWNKLDELIFLVFINY